MKTFGKWTTEEVEEYFHLVMVKNHPFLVDWLNAPQKRSSSDEQTLTTLRERLLENVYDWNEEELKIKFIAFLLQLVNYDEVEYHSFLEREISVNIDNKRLSGTIDFMVAKGRRSPKRPFFCLHEYKRERYHSNDPLGQLLIAMVAVQRLNNNQKSLYGAYIIGRQWFFVILDQKDYSISRAYDATEADIFEIFSILKNLKQIITTHLL